jgi:hypothetical protein
MIQERVCPRCAIKRTTWIAGRQVSVCFNCRLVWQAGEFPPALERLCVHGD